MTRLRSPICLRLAILLIVLAWASACAPSSTGPRVWIDVPTSGARLEPGQELQVISHAYAPGGLAEALLNVNGEPYRRDPVEETGEAFTEISQMWVAEHPGEYALEVVAYDVSGAASPPAVVWVSVRSPFLAPPVAEVSTPAAPPTEGPTVEVPTVTPYPAVTMEFWADRTDLASGECTTLHWQTQFATSVLLGTTTVEPQGTMQICPESSTSYRLRASGPAGGTERTVSLSVTAPPDSQGPSLSGLANSPASIWDGSGCGATTTTVTVAATDASGVAQIELHYRVIKGEEQGQWRTLSLSSAGGNTYSASLGPAQLAASLNLYGGGTVEYWVKATDNQGNTAQTGTSTFAAQLCFG